MTKKFSPELFKQLVDDTFLNLAKLADVKGGEYSGEEDRLRNFRKIGEDIHLDQETILYVYAKKHWDSITTYISDIQGDLDRVRSEPIEGRIDDLILYMLLLKAMVWEREGTKTPPITRKESYIGVGK